MKKYLPFLIIFLFCIPLLYPLFKSGFFVTDDANWLIIRLSAFYQALTDGQFPVRWVGRLNNGYGYPVTNFMYPGYLYLSAPMYMLFGAVTATKIFLAGTIIASSILMYCWLKTHFNSFAAICGSIIYIYSPYHLFDLYVRGSIGELLALTVVPCILWQIQRKNIVLTALGFTLLILSHNTLALIFLPLLFIYSLSVFKAKTFIVSLFFGLGLSAFFWIPALTELSYTRFSETKISDWSLYFSTSSHFGISTLVIILLGSIGLTYQLVFKKRNLDLLPVFIFIIIGIITLFFSTSISSFIWPYLPSQYVQFPFRLLSLVIICISFILAWVVSISKKVVNYCMVGVLLIIVFLEASVYLKNITYVDNEDGYYTTNMHTTTIHNEYMPKWVTQIPQNYPEHKVVVSEGVIENLTQNNHMTTFRVTSTKVTQVTVHTVYFPGWTVYSDKKKIDAYPQPSTGLITFSVPEGQHTIKIVFERTYIRFVSEMISLISIVIVCGYQIIRNKKNENKKD